MSRRILALVPLLFVSTVVQAGTMSQTGYVSTQDTDLVNQLVAPTFTQFNSALGTLNSVTIYFKGNAETTLSAKNNSSTTSQTFQATASVEFKLNSTVLTSQLDFTTTQNFGPDVLAASATKNYGTTLFSDDQTVTYTSPAELANFIGSGNLAAFKVDTLTGLNTAGSGGNISTTQLTQAGAEVVITYDYTPPAVPEPSSVVMLGLAGGIAVVASRLRKARA